MSQDDKKQTSHARALRALTFEFENPTNSMKTSQNRAEIALAHLKAADLRVVDATEFHKLGVDLERERVRLAACGVAAFGAATGENDCAPGDYGHSASFDAAKKLYARARRMEMALARIIDNTMPSTDVGTIARRGLLVGEEEWGPVDDELGAAAYTAVVGKEIEAGRWPK